MKKILFLLIILVLPPKISAEEKIDLGYMKENQEYSIDYEDYLLDYNEWSLEIPSTDNYETRSTLYYSEIKPIRYIHIYNFLGAGLFNITELTVTSNSERINFELYCDGCSTDFYEKITDGRFDYNDSFVSTSGYIRLDLKEYYSLENLKIEMYVTDFTTQEKRYEIATTREANLDKIYTNILERMWFTYKNNSEFQKREWHLGNILYISPEYTDYQIASNETQTKYRHIVPLVEYREFNKLYRHYEIVSNELIEEEVIEDQVEEKPLEKDLELSVDLDLPINEIIDKSTEQEFNVEEDSIQNEVYIEEVTKKPIRETVVIQKKKEETTAPPAITNPDVKKFLEVDEEKECLVEKKEIVTNKNNFLIVSLLILIIIVRGIIDVKNKLFSK